MKEVRENVRVIDNVTVTLTDINTGDTRVFSTHNISLEYQFSAISQWMASVNNTGYNAVVPPSQIEYGSGSGTPAVTDTGCFTPISGSLTNLNYVQANTPQNGTTTFVFQTAAGVVTGTITEAFVRDTSGNGWGHAMFGSSFTPSATETITTKYESTYSA